MILSLLFFFAPPPMDRMALPSAGEIVAKMVQRDDERQSALDGYTAVRRYVLENARENKRAEMLVRLTCFKDGSKQFEPLFFDGWGGARKHVFQRLLQAETEASGPAARVQSRISQENYSFEMLGREEVNGRSAYLLEIAPRIAGKFLMRGKIWVDAEEFAIVRIEGVPAKNPSFWIKSVHFAHQFQEHGSFWFPASDESLTDVRVFGPTRLTIDYFDYEPNVSSKLSPRS